MLALALAAGCRTAHRDAGGDGSTVACAGRQADAPCADQAGPWPPCAPAAKTPASPVPANPPAQPAPPVEPARPPTTHLPPVAALQQHAEPEATKKTQPDVAAMPPPPPADLLRPAPPRTAFVGLAEANEPPPTPAAKPAPKSLPAPVEVVNARQPGTLDGLPPPPPGWASQPPAAKPAPKSLPAPTDVLAGRQTGLPDLPPAPPTEAANRPIIPVAQDSPPGRPVTEDPMPSRSYQGGGPAGMSFGHAPDYAWLRGEVERSLRGVRLRYAPVDEADPYGGSVTLVSSPLVDGLRDGQSVRVRGQFLNPEQHTPAPPYRVVSVESAGR
jgi:hypothetical protein